MSMISSILLEMQQEAGATRKLLERVPDDKLGWAPHPKAMTLGQLALHVAEIPGLAAAIAGQDVMDVPSFEQAQAQSRAQVVETFEKAMAGAEATLSKLDDSVLGGTWRVTAGGKEVMAMPRGAALRSIALNHGYHHRGQLSTYLRALDVSLPVVYGRSADESAF
jgi:uncharacterized damage-inducible protein DinB